MAITTLNNASISVGGTDLSDHCVKIDIDDGVVEKDGVVFQDTAEHVQGGLESWTITAIFRQDYAASKVHETLRADINTNVALIIRVDGTAIRSGTNPEWAATGFFGRYKPLGDGQVGEIPMVEAVYKNAGSGLTCLTAAT